MKITIESFKAISYFVTKYKKIYVWFFIVSILYAVLESLNISIFFPLLQSVTGGDPRAGSVPFFAKMQEFITHMPFGSPFANACLLIIVVLIVKEAVAFMKEVLVLGYGVGRVITGTQIDIFQKYLVADYQYFLDHKQGAMMYKLMVASGRVGTCMQYVPNFFVSLLMTISIGMLLFFLSVKMTLILIFFGLLFNLLTHLLAKKVSYHVGTERAEVGTASTVTANEFIDGAKHIIIANSAQRWLADFKRSVLRFRDLNLQDSIWLAVPERLMQLVPVVLMIGAIVFLKLSNKAPAEFMSKNFAMIGVYMFAFYRLLPHIVSFGKYWMQIAGSLADVELLYRFLHEETRTIRYGRRQLASFSERIRFDNVSFAYKGRDYIIDKMFFAIPKGKTTAIVGPSGSGKSTVINLMLRLFVPQEGSITYDGIELKDLSFNSLTRMVGVVSQETFIFNDSIKNNITFGTSGVAFDSVVAAAKLAYADDFIREFPMGYDTIIGDKGLKISGGQRQRIAIARAMLRDPQILILDEATSALDYHSEAIVQKALNAAARNRTVIVIAHRLATIINSDHIILLDKGKVAEEGDHASLMDKKGIYYNLYMSQTK